MSVLQMEQPLEMEEPHKVLYGWDTDLSHPKIIEAGTKIRHVVEARNMIFVETPHLISSMDYTEDNLDDKYFSGEILQDCRDYDAALEDIPTDRGELHNQVTSDQPPQEEVLLGNKLSRGAKREEICTPA